jgi:uncharacterized membrane protein
MFKSRLPEHVPGPFDPVEPAPPQLNLNLSQLVLAGAFGLAQLVWLLTMTVFCLHISFPMIQQLLLPSTSSVDMHALARWLNANQEITALASSVHEGGRFTLTELHHYEDVRTYLMWVKFLILPTTFIWGILAMSIYNFTPIRLARLQILFIRTWVFLLVVLTIWGIFYWDSLFSLLHQPFFGKDSWRFPEDSYSLRLFPEWLWRIMGTLAALLPLFFSAVLYYFCSRQTTPNAYSRSHYD